MNKVCKFGGSSVAGAEQFRQVRHIIESDSGRRIVVVSAAGKRNKDDNKLTDLLYLCHAHLTYGVPCNEILQTIAERLIAIRDELGLTYDIETELDVLRARMNRDMPVDELVSRGEYFTSRLMAEYLGYHFVDASQCIYFGYDGQIARDRTYAAITDAVRKYGKVVIPGFYGSLPSGKLKVMTRGGSDITGALAAAAIDANVYENWTDVSGILMADPRIVPDPKPIERITYAELREMAFMGATVLHEESVQPVREAGIPINIRNTNRPEDPGTMILDSIDDQGNSDRFITGIAGRRNFTILTVNKRNMNTSLALRLALELLDRYHVPVEHITLGLDSFALVASTAALGDNLYAIVADIKKDIQPDDVTLRDQIALVAAVGRKMTFRAGSSGRLFKALGEHGVNIRTIAQGADELSILIGVDNKNYETAVRVMYDGFAG